MLYKHFRMSHSNERSVQRVEGVLLCHRNQSWSSPSWQCHLELWVIAELFTEIPVALDFIQTNAMYSGITEHSLKGKKRKACCLEWLRVLLVAIQGSYHSINLPSPQQKSSFIEYHI